MNPTQCALIECDRPRQSKGYCLMHYKRWRRWGDPRIRRPRRSYAESFDMYAERGPECWQWTGTIYRNGYGSASVLCIKRRIRGHIYVSHRSLLN